MSAIYRYWLICQVSIALVFGILAVAVWTQDPGLRLCGGAAVTAFGTAVPFVIPWPLDRYWSSFVLGTVASVTTATAALWVS